MGPRLSISKRSFDVMELQNEEDDMESTSQEIEYYANTKKLKQELDPLKIPNILEKIFSYLDVDSVKNARQVNSLWNVEGAKSLMTKCFVQIPRDADGSYKTSELKEFKFFKSSDLPMISNITISSLFECDVWILVGVVGPQVKAVKLKNIDGTVNLSKKSVNKKVYTEAQMFKKLLNDLPNLKYLYCENSLRYNLKIIEFLEYVLSEEKKDEITVVILNLTLECERSGKRLDISKILNSSNILIKELKFDFEFYDPPGDREVEIRNKLLSKYQSTLKKLTLINCQDVLPLLEFPCMTDLTHMDLDFNSGNQISRCKFPASFRFLEKVPNLQEICINFRRASFVDLHQSALQNLFENTGPARSVKRLKLLRDYTTRENTAEFLFEMFPNVEDLQTCGHWGSRKWFDSLCTLGTKLRKLRFMVGLDQLLGDFDLDSILTGFTLKTVGKIMNDPNLEPYSLETLNELRVNPSILNLKELENITIDLYCNGDPFVPKRMLTVAAKYAFRLLPKKPKVTIIVKDGGYGQAANAAMEALQEVSQLTNVSVVKEGAIDYWKENEFKSDLASDRETEFNWQPDSDTDIELNSDLDSDTDNDI